MDEETYQHTLELEIVVPAHMIDENGELRLEFYEPFLEMINQKRCAITEDGPIEYTVKEIHIGDLTRHSR